MALNLKKRDLRQFMRYIVVGVLNTLVTLAVIFLCKSLLDVNIWVSNALGYVAGVLNSFVWNKLWVFQSGSKAYRSEALRFMIGFLMCYALQFVVTWLLNSMLGGLEIDLWFTVISGYGVATLIGMVVYTLGNFVYNRAVTFKNQ